MLLYPHRLSAFVLFIPVIGVVQYVFSLGLAFIVGAVNVFFRDLGNVLRHALRLWFYLSPGLYSLSVLDASNTFQTYPILKVLAHANPIAVLFEAYRAVLYGTPEGSPHPPDMAALLALLIASLVLLAIGTIVFKRLEPSYAKVL
jgi:ABC-type polysaccharide/polyol phosphate export permease